MRNNTYENIQLIETSYHCLRQPLCRYFHRHISDMETCKDLVQETFLHLMEYKQMLCEKTIKNFLFTIARNLLYDYLRHSYLQCEVTSYLCDSTPTVHTRTEEQIEAHDILSLEQDIISRLSHQRKKVYTLARFEEKNVKEIAHMMQISTRTVENHLYISRKLVRSCIRQCI